MGLTVQQRFSSVSVSSNVVGEKERDWEGNKGCVLEGERAEREAHNLIGGGAIPYFPFFPQRHAFFFFEVEERTLVWSPPFLSLSPPSPVPSDNF